MEIINVADIAGMEFPAGRRTRVMVGPGAKLEAANFVMGHVTIYPGGSVPIHAHEQEEVYFIVAGQGCITERKKTATSRPAIAFTFVRPWRICWRIPQMRTW